eukprot:6491034-Amphidinium_carterae.2
MQDTSLPLCLDSAFTASADKGEPEEEEAPDEVQDEEVEEDDDEHYQPDDDQEEETGYSVGDTRYRSNQSQRFDRQSFQRRRLDDGGEWREYREGTRPSGRRTYEDGDRSHDRNIPYKRWSYKQTEKKGAEDDAFAARLKEHHMHVLWRRCTICYRRSMPPSWVWNRNCSNCQIHVCCKHSKEKVTPVYSAMIATAEGDTEAHIPIGSRHRTNRTRSMRMEDRIKFHLSNVCIFVPSFHPSPNKNAQRAAHNMQITTKPHTTLRNQHANF